MDNTRLIYLLQQYGKAALTPAEERELSQLLAGPYEASAEEEIQAALAAHQAPPLEVDAEELKPAIEKIVSIDRPRVRVIHRRRWGWVAAAAAAAILAVVFIYRVAPRKPAAAPAQESIAEHHPVLPGKNGAILTLSDGSQLVLDSLGNGVIAAQNGKQIVLQGGQLSYAPGQAPTGPHSRDGSTALLYNTITTPRGRQFRVVLPDGTRVWLNAASSIRYPTVFTGDVRQVELDGEAYFEVAANAKQPFKVVVAAGEEVEVLGTAFNITSYRGGKTPLRTTLVQGTIRVRDRAQQGRAAVTLKPGEQAELSHAGTIRINTDVDLDKVLAWKNGLFNFQGMSLQEAMSEIQRWYNIDITYEGRVPDITFFGEMSRSLSLDALLQGLQGVGVRCHFKGETLVVTP